MIVLGIDPGSVSAAWARIDHTVVQGGACGDIPVVDGMVNGAGFAEMLVQSRVDVAVIEKVNAFPKQGVSSSFRFGMGTGIIHGVLAALVVRRVDVSPTVWKKHYRLSADKEAARGLALQRWPWLSKLLVNKRDAGRAEALLIAQWWVETNPR